MKTNRNTRIIVATIFPIFIIILPMIIEYFVGQIMRANMYFLVLTIPYAFLILITFLFIKLFIFEKNPSDSMILIYGGFIPHLILMLLITFGNAHIFGVVGTSFAGNPVLSMLLLMSDVVIYLTAIIKK